VRCGPDDNSVVTNATEIPDDDEIWWRVALSTLTAPGDRIVWQAIHTFGAKRAIDEMWAGRDHSRMRRLAGSLDASPGDIVAFHRRYPKPPDLVALAATRRATRKLNLVLLGPHSTQWPERLEDLGPYQPIVLFARGDAAFLRTMPTLGVVGSRSPTSDGLGAARSISHEAVECGYALVSGGARGIDWVAHTSARAIGAPQVMVLATASDRLGSWQTAMVNRVAHDGVVFTETPPAHAISPASFLHRNRVIAALSDRVVVVEAAERSGSLNTASHAKTLGRDLSAVISRPRDEKNAGCYRLVDEWAADCYRVSPRTTTI